MTLSAASAGFGFLAGVLSILSPCVLPLLPLVLGPAASAGRFGLPALAAGLVLSFVTVGLFVATIGFSIGLDGDFFRLAAAVLLAGLGIVLLSASLQNRFAVAAGGVSDAGNRWIARISPQGSGGQFVLGLLLGTVWSPCVGPTLGAASLLAAQGRSLGAVAAVMAAFGLGAALPLLLLGSLSREAMRRWRGTLTDAGKGGKRMLGVAALAVGLLILTGLDHRLEAFALDRAPDWLVALTARF
ncbi:MAG: sulfite exporter TauE/SafE family protein [Proteobacteria bacterium]|nr:sulfite exporter TauE/SafE family protein [Pseudomonadota bacterium]